VIREKWVDYAKAIGILLVVYGHVARGLVSAGLMADTDFYRYIDSIIYTFHMPLFFFLSGLFLISTLKSKGVGVALGSKVDAVLYPYILWSLIQGVIEITLSNYTNGSVTLTEVLSLFTEPRAQFWFLYALFFIFIVSFTLISFLGVRVLPVLFFLSIISYVYRFETHSVAAIDFLCSNSVFFLFGAIYQQYGLSKLSSTYTTLVIFVLAILGQYWFHYSGYDYLNKGFPLLILSTLSLISVVNISVALSGYNFIYFAYVGSSSMAIYLMHILAGSGARVILNKLLGVDYFILHLLIGTALGVFLPLMVLKAINFSKFQYAFSFPISRLWKAN